MIGIFYKLRYYISTEISVMFTMPLSLSYLHLILFSCMLLLMGSHLLIKLRCSSSTAKKFVKIIDYSYQYDSPHPFLFPQTYLKLTNYINCNLHRLFMKVVCSKIHVTFIIILTIFQNSLLGNKAIH